MSTNTTPEAEVQEKKVTPDNRVRLEKMGMDVSALNDEEVATLYSIISKTQHYAPKNLKATKEQEIEMYASEHVFTEDGETTLVTESTQRKKELQELNASAQSKRILVGKIIGCVSANPENPAAPISAEVRYGTGQWKVIIPSHALFDYKGYEYADAGTQERLKKYINDMIGAEIRFVVRQVDQKLRIAVGDRLQAMHQDAFANYINSFYDGKPRIKAGVLAQGTVIRVNKNSITIYVLGSDVVLPRNVEHDQYELSWCYIADCRDEFKTGDKVNVRILACEPYKVKKWDNEYTLVKCAASIKRCTADPMTKHFDRINVQDRWAGVITHIPTEGKGMFVKIFDSVDVMVAYPKRGELPVVGQDVVVEITEKVVEENGRKKLFGILCR